jgi:hypothetical protein
VGNKHVKLLYTADIVNSDIIFAKKRVLCGECKIVMGNSFKAFLNALFTIRLMG